MLMDFLQAHLPLCSAKEVLAYLMLPFIASKDYLCKIPTQKLWQGYQLPFGFYLYACLYHARGTMCA